MDRDVDVIAVSRVNIHSMEAGTRAIDDLEALSLLHSQVHQQRAVREVSKGLWGETAQARAAEEQNLGTYWGLEWDYLEGHEFVVGFGGPGIHLH